MTAKLKKLSPLEEGLMFQIRAMKLPVPEREYRFSAHHVGMGPGIKLRLANARLKDWRFDFAYPDYMLAIECEGGGGGGRHGSSKGMRQDMEKYHAAMDLGWNIYRCDKSLITSGASVELIAKLLGLIDQNGRPRSQ